MNSNNSITIKTYTSQTEATIPQRYFSINIGCKVIYYDRRHYGTITEIIIAVKDLKESRLFLINDWIHSNISMWGSKALGTKKQILQQIEEGKIILVENFNLKEILEECW